MGDDGPTQGYRQFSPWTGMGPFTLISGFLHGRQWAHSSLLAVSSWTGVGPLMLIGSFLHGQEWAHSRSSAVFFIRDNGPT